MQRTIVFFIVACAFIGGVAAGALGLHVWDAKANLRNTINREGGYVLVNPLLTCDISENASAPELNGIKNRIAQESDALLKSGVVKRISVYFRDMNTGAWTGVNEDELYSPASLMKVSLLIAYLKNIEEDPPLVMKTLTLSPMDQNADEYYRPESTLQAAGTYAVQDLLKTMIRDSDNNAAIALGDNISTERLARVYENFGTPGIHENETHKDLMSPKIYMRFFRILYNASYLSKQFSHEALGVLTTTSFDDGIVAGVPTGTLVAHKFGERTVKNGDLVTGETTVVKLELHDCGIVYYPGAPYGICIMTEGNDFPILAEAITAISKEAYASWSEH